MADVCQKCGLPKELCICETIAKESQRIKIRKEKRRFGKWNTIIEGIDPKNIDLREIAKKLKSIFACGGTVKNNTIELQGNHVNKVKAELMKLGFAQDSIDTE